MARKIAMTDGQSNLAIDKENVPYLESIGWTRIVQEEDDDNDEASADTGAADTDTTTIGIKDLQVITGTVPETTEATSPAPEAQALAEAVEQAKTPSRRR